MVGILLSYWVSAYFQGRLLLVSGRVGKDFEFQRCLEFQRCIEKKQTILKCKFPQCIGNDRCDFLTSVTQQILLLPGAKFPTSHWRVYDQRAFSKKKCIFVKKQPSNQFPELS